MLVFELLHLPFTAFIRTMMVPNVLVIIVNLLIFVALFGRQLPRRLRVEERGVHPWTMDPARFRLAMAVLLGVIVGLIAAGLRGWPLSFPAIAGAVALTILGLARRELTAHRALQHVAWTLPLFVVGMYVVVLAANREALAPLWLTLLQSGGQSISTFDILRVAAATAVGANLVNNLPMALIGIDTLQRLPTVPPALAFATVIGTNVGPNVTVFGSLATMLVLSVARRRGIQISTRSYVLVGLLATPPLLLTAALGVSLLG